MQRSAPFVVGEYYHVYNRGTEKRMLFIDDADAERFVSLLYLCNSGIPIHRSDHRARTLEDILYIEREATLVDIGAYCLMPNHFHILLREHSEGGTSLFMKKLLTAYAMYFNNKYERKGTLFEGPFRSRHVESDIYLKYLFAYIHLNPIGIIDAEWKHKRISNRKDAKQYLSKYAHSSYLDYVSGDSKRRQSAILNKLAFPEYFEKKKDFTTYINDWISGSEIE